MRLRSISPSLSLYLSISIAGALPAIAWSQDQDKAIRQALVVCLDQKDTTIRIACYDNIANSLAKSSATKEEAKLPPDSTTRSDDTGQDDEASTRTADIIKPSPEIEFKVVDSEDMYVAPDKYTNRGVEMRNVQCFHADKDEYRCLATSSGMPLVLMSPEITPSAEKTAIEEKCGEIKKVSTQQCRKNVHFIPLGNTEDIIGGYQKRVVILTKAIEIIPAPIKKKKK
ncbi:hypothetical protein [Lamprocystis purpurea]|uniref:hypothetical protein n=1 Tax=Lamprocystis purpurea TaxID=61598 RepID=UPI0012FA8E1E|nr:hypothetical protein [Lamprocystis purpurea]MBV5347973.1 hypothetical protein [bacterium]